MRAAVLTVSDRSSRGEREDASGPALRECLAALGFEVTLAPAVADERGEISARIRDLAAAHDLVLTTGGTGLSPRDVTPEATRDVIDREAPGLPEEMRRRSAERFPRAILSRGVAGTLGRCLVVNLPGSPSGAVECLGYVAPVLVHAIRVLGGGVRDCAADADADRGRPRERR
jgi:molybdenum cofactor synthesis domain-containing protein